MCIASITSLTVPGSYLSRRPGSNVSERRKKEEHLLQHGVESQNSKLRACRTRLLRQESNSSSSQINKHLRISQTWGKTAGKISMALCRLYHPRLNCLATTFLIRNHQRRLLAFQAIIIQYRNLINCLLRCLHCQVHKLFHSKLLRLSYRGHRKLASIHWLPAMGLEARFRLKMGVDKTGPRHLRNLSIV